MALLDAIKNAVKSDEEPQEPGQKTPEAVKTPPEVKKKIERGKERLKQVAARRRQAIEFANNNHYVYITEDYLRVNSVSTVAISDGGFMPDHRVRKSHDLIGPIVKRKISTAVQRIPGYEVIPANESEWASLAAKVAEKVLYAGYEKWEVKRAVKKLIWNALVTEEGFIGTRWDTNVGPFVDVSQHPENPMMPDPENPSYVGMGEIALYVYNGLEVMWEPGVEFENSRWVCIESAVPRSVLEEDPEFISDGEKLKADAQASLVPLPYKIRSGTELVMRSEFLERPSPNKPEGQRLILANGRIIFPPEKYPVLDNEGKVADEPPLRKLSYAVDAASDKDRGLVPSLVDAMRTYDMAANKIQEGIQLGQVPQIMAPEGSIITPITDEPGLVVETDPNVVAGSNSKPEWRTDYQIPSDVYREREIAKEELSSISFDSEIPANVESGKQVQAIYERDQIAWQDFIIDLADIYAGVARDCLSIVQYRYSEDRLIKFRGAAGWENLSEFRGADIKGQTDVRVSPGSLESRTRASIEARLSQINAMFPGYFPPPVMITALNSAQPEKLVETFENDETRAYRIIQLIKNGGFWDVKPRPLFPGEEAPLLDPVTEEPVIDYRTGKPFQMESVPGWMPRKMDNADLHKQIFENWMKTSDFEELEPEAMQAAMLYYGALLDMQTKEAERRAALQTQTAEAQGMMNAGKAQGPKALPSQPNNPSPEAALAGSPEGMSG